MRITFVLPDANLGGGTRMIAQHADILCRRGHDVFILSRPPWDLPLRVKVTTLLKGKPWPPRPPHRPPSHLDGLDLNHRTLSRRRPVTDRDLPDADVVIATWWQTAPGVASLSKSKGAKAYFIQHYEALLGHSDELVGATWRLPLQKIVCAQWLADLSRDRFNDPNAIVARNGLNVELFDTPPRGRQAVPTVGMMYSPSPAKGWDAGLEAFASVARRVPGLKLKAFGTSTPSTPLPPGSEFSLMPPQRQIREIYASCDVWLCSSRSEGYHMPPIEAMGCRCPPVATKVGGPGDVIQEGISGFLVDIDDVEAIAEKVVGVLNLSLPEWTRLSDAAYATARDFNASDATDVFEQALYATIERSGAQAVPAAESRGAGF